MKKLHIAFVAAWMSWGCLLVAQQHQLGVIENTTAPMSEKVMRQRLTVLGYTDVRITKTNTLKYKVDAMRQGQPVVLDFHPQAGLIRDVTPRKAVAKPWTMPLEPPAKAKIREELPPRK